MKVHIKITCACGHGVETDEQAYHEDTINVTSLLNVAFTVTPCDVNEISATCKGCGKKIYFSL